MCGAALPHTTHVAVQSTLPIQRLQSKLRAAEGFQGIHSYTGVIMINDIILSMSTGFISSTQSISRGSHNLNSVLCSVVA